MHTATVPVVHILLATYQGAKHLREQLDSIAAQSYPAWTLTISDDGSTDQTVQIAKEFAQQHQSHSVTILEGPRQRSTANFFHLINTAPCASVSDLYAFCDQDDVWLADKLDRAVSWHNKEHHFSTTPLLYCARTQLVDEQLRPIGLSVAPKRPLSFGNALLQNIASGNTMVFNQPLLKVLHQIPAAHSVWHDWTAYQVATGCGGQVFYDTKPALLYRQHAANVIGATSTGLSQIRRAQLILTGRYRDWGEKTVTAIGFIENQITPGAHQQVAKFRTMRSANGPLMRLKLGLYNGSELYRQTVFGQVAFLCALAVRLV
jgi:glycosyltransferase involved in cell wall biosynthesis